MNLLLALVVLVPGVGTDGRVFDLPGASLVNSLEHAGHDVMVLDSHLGLAAKLHRIDQPFYVVGLDLGGTTAYLAAPETPRMLGVVGIGAPIAFGGATSAMRHLFKTRPASWRDAPDRAVQVLLGTGWRRSTADAFPRVPLSLDRWAGLDGGRSVPKAAALDALRERPKLRVLVITAPADGVAPPWMCDPAAFELKRPGLTSVWVTRANGFSMEYRHLDLLLHPRAPGEIHPLIERWLVGP
jgi:pimeloyl-ACP methyl ester carboxylesterase